MNPDVLNELRTKAIDLVHLWVNKGSGGKVTEECGAGFHVRSEDLRLGAGALPPGKFVFVRLTVEDDE